MQVTEQLEDDYKLRTLTVDNDLTQEKKSILMQDFLSFLIGGTSLDFAQNMFFIATCMYVNVKYIYQAQTKMLEKV